MGPAESLSLRRYGASPGSHSHAHFQILLGLSGALELEVEGRGWRVDPGAGCVIAPGDRHDFASSGGSLCLVLDSSHSDWARCAAQRAGHSILPAPALPLVRYLATALRHRAPLAQVHGPALLREAWLADSIDRATTGSPGSHVRRRPIDWTALEQWAAQQWHTPLTVADLAQRVHLSPSQFAARCRDDRGVSAMAWLRSLRLEHAQLLRDSGLAVGEVARRTGYRSPSALTAALRRLQA
ncbi:AraC family transcriptional regulator [Acidovorax radicis]|uniref:AraC family transcriptional regulator n=1 Tax=Acidovorax radicis TaxID=758826 RepID=UPI0002377FFD|nr:AraC family transcriptional regulator [Acidovorax radicis]